MCSYVSLTFSHKKFGICIQKIHIKAMAFFSRIFAPRTTPMSSNVWIKYIRNFSSQAITSPTSVTTSQINHKDFSQERKMTALELQNLNRKGY